MAAPVDDKLLGRYAILVALTQLFPVPLLDRFVEDRLRRGLVRALARRRGLVATKDAARVLGDVQGDGCLSLLLWPVKKLLRAVSVVFQVKAMADVYTDVVHRGLLVDEAYAQGWAQADSRRTRAAIDRAMSKVDTRPLERWLFGRFRDRTDRRNRLVAEATRIARERDADPTELAPKAEVSGAMTSAIRQGLVAEIVPWFRLEMGDVPKLEARLHGVMNPELLPADPVAPQTEATPAVEDAVEVRKRDEGG